MKADEKSERVLELTATALSYNAANYSVWWVDTAWHTCITPMQHDLLCLSGSFVVEPCYKVNHV